MEGDPEESDEEVQREDKPTVLWEKCIQQSIFVDLSEDESLHLSDLESSLALHLSQAESAASEASIHLSAGSAELSPLDVTSSESSIVSSQSERVVGSKTSSSSILHVSAQRPNTMQDEIPLNQRYEDPEQNTSDEDQDDLPYDGDLGSLYFNQAANSESSMSSDGRETVHASPNVPGLLECHTRDRDDTIEHLVSAEKPATLSQEDANTKQDNLFDASKPSEVAPSCPYPADINQLLLRHFSQEELLWTGRLIEAETLPEVSLLESVDDTVYSWAPTQKSTTLNSNRSESPACNSEKNQIICCDRTDEKSNTVSREDEEAEREIDNVISAATDSITSSSASINSKHCSEDTSAVDVVKQERAEEEDQVQRAPLVRTRSFSEMKYGQGQVHYKLPDFSKVAPRVKIPKAPSCPARPVPQSPTTMHRAQPSPVMLEVISRVLEDAVQPSEKPYVFKDEDKETPPALVHHLQAEYDKLLTKYAEAENLIDQMRLGTNTQPSSDLMLDLECDDDHKGNPQPVFEGSHLGSLAPHLPPSDTSLCLTSDIMTENLGEKGETTTHSNIKEANTASSGQPEVGPSDGEIMTAELKDIINQFMEKVEELKLSVSNMSVSTAEQQMMLRSIMEAQDQLERKYISKKEEHRALEMQNYMGLSRNTGTFDPNRLVEGDIFRIGMHLEDIKDMIDKNVCEQISPPHSSSTPAPMKDMLHVQSSPLCMPAPSPPPSLHEGLRAGFSIAGYKMETRKEKEVEQANEVHRGDGLQQSGERITTDCHQSSFRSSLLSLEGLEIQTAEAEEERSSALSELIDHSNILAYLSGTSSSSRQRQWTPDSHSAPDSFLSPVGKCDLGECVSLAVEVSSSPDAPRDSATHSLSESPLNTSSVSQRIVSPETDSGFGSSYLNQSASGPFQQNLLTQSVQSQNDGLSSSDSEGSCSNLQTAIHSVSLTSPQWASPHPSVQTQSCVTAAAVERWVESTTKEPSVRLQGSECSLPAQLHHHMSEPVLGITMTTEERGRPLYSCSCNRPVYAKEQPVLVVDCHTFQGLRAGFSIAGYKMETRKEKEVEQANEVHRGDGLQQSGERITTDCHQSSFRSSLLSLEGLEIQTAEAEEERSSALSELIDHSNILAYLSGTSSSSRQRQWTPDSHSAPDSFLSPVGKCDLGECVSLAVEVSSSPDAPRDSATHSLSESPLNTSSVSQRIVSPETDSGFGSSYLNQSASGPFQQNLLTQSVQSQNDGLSSSDSEGSCSNLQTAIHSVSLTSPQWASPHPSVQTQSCVTAAAVERWVESTTKEPSVRLQGSECSLPAQLHHHMSEPVLGITMTTEERGRPLYSCSCNSEAILALQSEVSRLKKDLEEGLVQLPHLTEKMDYLTSKYRQDRQERRSKTRSRTHHRPACNSVWKPSSSRQNVSNLSSSQVWIDNWISSDMDPDKSKGTDSGDTAGSENMLQFHNSPVWDRRSSSSVRSAPEFRYKLQGALQSSRGSEGHGSVTTSGLTRSILKGGKEEASDSHTKQRPQTAVMESLYCKERWSLFSSPSLQKPLLQVSYGSSSSLPASFKVRERPLQSTCHQRKHSTQSDTALLPSNVYFQRTMSPVSVPTKTGIRTGRRKGSKEEEMNRNLDQAIEVARSIKRTTDQMAKRLSADLAKAQLHRKVLKMQPQGGRKYQA
ncbi:uncharacterized protein LOC123972488 [Micropterus dolomieu]|uniref:uncharacterized protein LOC123972488 n=1 Tax=Micropterus dolomieu TaxID=147949 RepID=UPI001E8E1BFA|nr:uncharacterized protein LOC123972488 [Micropterus dolomieu]